MNGRSFTPNPRSQGYSQSRIKPPLHSIHKPQKCQSTSTGCLLKHTHIVLLQSTSGLRPHLAKVWHLNPPPPTHPVTLKLSEARRLSADRYHTSSTPPPPPSRGHSGKMRAPSFGSNRSSGGWSRVGAKFTGAWRRRLWCGRGTAGRREAACVRCRDLVTEAAAGGYGSWRHHVW